MVLHVNKILLNCGHFGLTAFQLFPCPLKKWKTNIPENTKGEKVLLRRKNKIGKKAIVLEEKKNHFQMYSRKIPITS